MKRIVVMGLFLGCLVPASMGHAFRCGSDLVQEGDRRFEVRMKCGEPDDVTVHEDERELEVIRGGHKTRERFTVLTETWTYNFGPERFIQILTFEDGELVEIESGDYGF